MNRSLFKSKMFLIYVVIGKPLFSDFCISWTLCVISKTLIIIVCMDIIIIVIMVVVVLEGLNINNSESARTRVGKKLIDVENSWWRCRGAGTGT